MRRWTRTLQGREKKWSEGRRVRIEKKMQPGFENRGDTFFSAGKSRIPGSASATGLTSLLSSSSAQDQKCLCTLPLRRPPKFETEKANRGRSTLPGFS